MNDIGTKRGSKRRSKKVELDGEKEQASKVAGWF